MLERLNSVNNIPVLPIDDAAFSMYGRVVRGYDWQELLRYMQEKTKIPGEGNCYVASEHGMEALQIADKLRHAFYGGLQLQIGYCNGNNNKLNCLEYHKSSELDVSVTPLVLLLAHISNICDNTISSNAVKAFYLPAGTAVELYGTTLHFSPCKVHDSGFMSVIILPHGTNQPLSYLPSQCSGEDALLWLTNKWLVSFPDTLQADKGAFVGIEGTNIEISY